MADGLVLIPAYNEAERLTGVLNQIRDEAPNFDILVVDDGSDDDTAAIAVARHPFNLGYGAALQTGYRYALRIGHRVLVQIDGDGQHDPKSIPQLAQPILDDELDGLLLRAHLPDGDQPRLLGSAELPFGQGAGPVPGTRADADGARRSASGTGVSARQTGFCPMITP